MKSAVVLCVFLFFQAEPSLAIYGGKPLKGRTPVGALLQIQKDGRSYRMHNSGVLIEKDLVLMTSHNLQDLIDEDGQVKLPKSDSLSVSFEYQIGLNFGVKQVVHQVAPRGTDAFKLLKKVRSGGQPDFDDYDFLATHDLALVRLFVEPPVKPAEVVPSKKIDEKGFLAGYGFDKKGNEGNLGQRNSVDVVHWQPHRWGIAWTVSVEGGGASAGDSGGFWGTRKDDKWKLYGIQLAGTRWVRVRLFDKDVLSWIERAKKKLAEDPDRFSTYLPLKEGGVSAYLAKAKKEKYPSMPGKKHPLLALFQQHEISPRDAFRSVTGKKTVQVSFAGLKIQFNVKDDQHRARVIPLMEGIPKSGVPNCLSEDLYVLDDKAEGTDPLFVLQSRVRGLVTGCGLDE